MTAGREVFWNVGVWGNIVYVVSAIALGIFIWAAYRRYLLWRSGMPDNRLDRLGSRINSFVPKLLVEVFGHRQILREPFAGVMYRGPSPRSGIPALTVLFFKKFKSNREKRVLPPSS